jgi:hypothetical protein
MLLLAAGQKMMMLRTRMPRDREIRGKERREQEFRRAGGAIGLYRAQKERLRWAEQQRGQVV